MPENNGVGLTIKVVDDCDDIRLMLRKGVVENERWHIRKDGSSFYAGGALRYSYRESVLTGYVKIVRDMTERVEMSPT
jgi:PAS domain-containing protein